MRELKRNALLNDMAGRNAQVLLLSSHFAAALLPLPLKPGLQRRRKR